jgi:hypothetical protein
MLLRREGTLRVSACPLTDDDVRFDLGTELAAAMAATVAPRHPRCATCLLDGVNYWGGAPCPT